MRGVSTEPSEGRGVIWRRTAGVIVSFASGDPDRARKMAQEILGLEPNRQHFIVCLDQAIEIEGITTIFVSSRDPYLEARRALRGLRIGLAPVLFDGGSHPLRLVAALLAPRKILAFNSRLERHHLSLASPIASTLFYNGVQLDRILFNNYDEITSLLK